MPEECEAHENVQWTPLVSDCDLMMYLRAARSMAAFAGMCDGGSADDGCIAACRDDTTLNAMDTLHNSNYDTGRALQALVKNPVPRGIEKKWTEDEQKRFVKGLRQYGKNFFKIRKELLPQKETSELVEFYYLWKKTPAAVSNRPHRRHRRQTILRKIRGGARSNRVQSNEYGTCKLAVDASSASEEENESDDSDSRDLNGYYCHHCSTTTSNKWHPVGKEGAILCSECCVFYKNGELRPLTDEPSSFLFKPLKEDETSQGETKQGVRTRRNKEGTADAKFGNNGNPSSRTATPEIADSPVSAATIGVQLNKGRKSPSTWSTCSTSSTDRLESGNKKSELEINPQTRKRVPDDQVLETEAENENKSKKVKIEDRSGSPTESVMSESGSLSNEENGHDGDNEQDGPSFPSSPSVRSPSPLDNENIKTKIVASSMPISGIPSVQIPNPIAPIEQQLLQSQIKHNPSSPPLQSIAPPPLISTPCGPPSIAIRPEMPTLVKQEIILPEDQPMRIASPCRSPSPTVPVPPLNAVPTSDQSKHQEESLDLVRRSPYPPIIQSSASPMLQMSSHPCSPSPAHQQPPHSSMSLSQPARISSPISYNKHLAIIPGMPHCSSSSSISPHSIHNYPPPLPHQLSMHQPSQFVSPGRFNPMEPPPPAHAISHQHMGHYPLLRPAIPDLHVSPSARSPSGRMSPMMSPSFNPSVHSLRRAVPPMSLPVEATEFEVDEDEEPVVPTRAPSPEPRVDDSECHRSQSAVFLRHWNRGECSSCTRTDLTFKPVPGSKLAVKREEKLRKQAEKEREERERAEAKTMCTPEIKNSSEPKNGQHSVGMESPMRHPSPYERCTPRGYSAHDTPALRQLSEYARPHTAFSPNMPRSMPPSMQLPPHGIDPMLHYQLSAAGLYPPGARERIEYEFEREKREQEIRERELRERMIHDKLKELEMKPALARLPPGAGPLESHWLDMHRRFATMPGGQVVAGMPPGPYAIYAHGGQIPGGILERERMERLGLAPHVAPSDGTYSGSVERLSAERLHAERMALTADPLLRFQMAGMAPPPGHMMGSGPGVPQQGTIDGHQLLQVYPRPGMLPRDAALLHPSAAAILGRQYEDQLAHQLSAHAQEQFHRQMVLERERYPPPGAQLHPTMLAQHEEYLRQQQQRDREMKIRTLEEAARGGRPYDHMQPGEKR